MKAKITLSKKIKILNVLTLVEDGGMETLVSRIYKGLEEKNRFDLYICILRDSEESYLHGYYKKACKDVLSLKLNNKDLKLKDYIAIAKSFFRLASYIKKNKIDVVHSHDFFSAFVTRCAVIISRFLLFYKPRKNYVTLHNTLYWLSKSHNFLNRRLAAVTDKIICVSKAVYEFSRSTDKIKDSKYFVIYNGIDTDLFKQYEGMYASLRKELGFSESDTLIGNISTFSVRKGHIYLLKAFNELVKLYPNLKLVFVGSKRSHEENIASEIFAFINNNNLDKYVKILDTRPDIYKIYNILDVYIMPSIVEGYGLALAEAMSSGLLCIGSDIPAFKELVQDDENGFLFESKNADDLNAVASKVISQAGSLSRIRENARSTIVNNFSSKKMIDGYYQLYNIYEFER